MAFNAKGSKLLTPTGGKSWSSPIQPAFQKTESKGKGGGWGKGWGKWDMWSMMKGMMKGKGKGKGLRDFPNSVKVWIGDIAEGTDYKALQEHMKQAGNCKFCTVFNGKGQGTAGAAFATAEEAAAAIASLNGSVLNGGTIVVDVWEKQPKVAEVQA